MILYFWAKKELVLESPTPQQVEDSLDELLTFTDDPKLKKEGFLLLASDRQGFFKKYKPPILQVLASAYGWFVEYVDEDESISRTPRNAVSEQDLRAAFLRFLENPGRPENLTWREETPDE